MSTARPTDGVPERHDRLATLDGWRAVAILLVVADHAYQSFRNVMPESLRPSLSEAMVISTGLLGVHIFFGISGFLITSRLLAEHRRHGRISLRGFYLRRLFRIFPAAWVFLAVMGLLALVGALPISRGHWTAALLAYANYTYADRSWYLGHFWSLAVEEHFYLVWPALMILFGARRGIFVSGALLLLIPIWRALDFHFQFIPAPNGLFWGRSDVNADFLAAGCLSALLLDHERVRALAQRYLVGWRWTLLAAAVLVATYATPGNWKITFALVSVVVCCIPPMLVGTVIHPSFVVSRLLETRPMRWIGKLSYSLYLWQQVFLVWSPWQSPALRGLQHFPVNVGLAFGFACLSHYLVEQPLIQVGRTLIESVALYEGVP